MTINDQIRDKKLQYDINRDAAKNGEKTLKQVEEDQKIFKKHLCRIKSGNADYKSEKQLYAIKNVINRYNSRQENINLLNDSAKIRSEAIYKSKQSKVTKGAGFKTLTSKEMVERLPIVLAQVKRSKLFILSISQNISLKKYKIT